MLTILSFCLHCFLFFFLQYFGKYAGDIEIKTRKKPLLFILRTLWTLADL